MAIVSFGDPATSEVYAAGVTKRNIGWRGISKIVIRKSDMLNYAAHLCDLRSPPGNRLEALKNKLAGYHSIRVNDQWRIVFRWSEAGPAEVRVCDYH